MRQELELILDKMHALDEENDVVFAAELSKHVARLRKICEHYHGRQVDLYLHFQLMQAQKLIEISILHDSVYSSLN